jgi:hypothetical protein
MAILKTRSEKLRSIEISQGRQPADRQFSSRSISRVVGPIGSKMADRDNRPIIETAQEARGAEPGPTVRNVLVWSLGLIVAAFAIVYFLFFKT